MPEKTTQTVQRIAHERVLSAFRALGFSEDVYRGNIVVLRQSDFPFRRITLPDSPSVSSELIRLYLTDLGIDVGVFYQLIKNNRG